MDCLISFPQENKTLLSYNTKNDIYLYLIEYKLTIPTVYGRKLAGMKWKEYEINDFYLINTLMLPIDYFDSFMFHINEKFGISDDEYKKRYDYKNFKSLLTKKQPLN